MEILLSVTAFFLVFVAGAGISLLLLDGSRQTNWLELLILAFLFGAGFVSLTFFLLGFLFSEPLLRWLVTLACVGIGSLGLRLRRSTIPQLTSVRFKLKSALLVAALLIPICVVGWLAMHSVLGFDGLIVWEYKARLAFVNGGRIPASYFRDVTQEWTHHEYPLYLPLTQAWLYSWLGRTDQGWVKMVFPLFYACATGLLFIGGSRLGGRRWEGFTAASLLFFVPYAIGEVGSPSGYGDFPLATVYLGSLVYLIEYVETGSLAALRIASGLAALLTWVKMEGVVLWSIVAILLVIISIRRRQWKALPLVLVPGAVLFGGWRMFLEVVDCPPKALYMPVTLENLSKNMDRVPSLAQWMAAETTNWNRWNLLWPLLIIALFYLGKKAWSGKYLSLVFAIVTPLLLYTATYIFSNWQPYLLHVESSLSRLMLAPAIVAVLIIGTATLRFARPRHFHPADAAGKEKPSSTHHEY